jgi:hypothetical protein
VNDVDLTKLRAPFPADVVGKLPRATCRACSNHNCSEHRATWCDTCKSTIGKHIHLDYVGHADVTIRLLEVDPEWSWAPKATDPDPDMLKAALASGNPDIVRHVIDNAPPKFERDRNGNAVGLWMNLTVGGVTRPGYGSCPGNQNDAEKVLIGDALRNAAMRFGVAVDLWAKGDRADPTAENATASGGRSERGGRAPQSAVDAFDNASPARPDGNGQQRQWKPRETASNGTRQQQERRQPAGQGPQRPAGPDLGDWDVKIAEIGTPDDVIAIKDEVTQLYDRGALEAERANEIRRAIDARVAELRGRARQAQQQPAAEPESGQDADGGESAWAVDFTGRAGGAGSHEDIRGLKLELARAVKDKTVTPEIANELGDVLKNRQNELRSAA